MRQLILKEFHESKIFSHHLKKNSWKKLLLASKSRSDNTFEDKV